MTTFGFNKNALMVGFGGDGRKMRLVYSGNNLEPFAFFNVNVEYPSYSTFATITMDDGIIDVGTYGINITDQQSSKRIDLQMPNNVFEVQYANNGVQRVNGVRDFEDEWIYISYPYAESSTDDDNTTIVFPTETFLLNYRDQTWSILYENFTASGSYRALEDYSWANIPYATWADWKEAWNTGTTTTFTTQVIGGNPQGYVLIRGEGTGEAQSGSIVAITSSAMGMTQITSYNHCVAASNPRTGESDYLYFQNCIGSTYLNGQVGQVLEIVDLNNFIIGIPYQSFTYLGLGTYARLSQPWLQTKQFEPYWEQGRQVILGIQKYLLERYPRGQITVYIYLSTDENNPYNSTLPDLENLINSGLISSNIISTDAETNNLQTPTAASQATIWHRNNQALIGATFQIGITLSKEQMMNYGYATGEIELHAIQFTIRQGPLLC
jgi:hypothetical protein